MVHRYRHVDRPDVRFARRLHVRDSRGGPPPFVGVAVLTLGVLFLLDNLNLIEARSFIRTYWPILLVGWGSARVLFGRGGERFVGGVAIAAGAALLGNRLLGWGLDVWDLVWPLLMIALGIHFLFHSYRRRLHARVTEPPSAGAPVIDTKAVDQQSDAEADESATFRQFAVMASVKRKNVSQVFRGGQITAVMGSAEIDLRDCRMTSDEVHAEVFVMMGEVVFRIPRDWIVVSRVSAVMANFEDRSDVPVEASSKRFIINGSAFMGNIEIMN